MTCWIKCREISRLHCVLVLFAWTTRFSGLWNISIWYLLGLRILQLRMAIFISVKGAISLFMSQDASKCRFFCLFLLFFIHLKRQRSWSHWLGTWRYYFLICRRKGTKNWVFRVFFLKLFISWLEFIHLLYFLFTFNFLR